VTAIILIGIAAAVIIGLSLTFGGPLVGAILAVVLIVGAIIWFITAARSGTTLGEIAREAPDQEIPRPRRAGRPRPLEGWSVDTRRLWWGISQR
jgi:hypothetical protein